MTKVIHRTCVKFVTVNRLRKVKAKALLREVILVSWRVRIIK